jgi:hypothetical protein
MYTRKGIREGVDNDYNENFAEMVEMCFFLSQSS